MSASARTSPVALVTGATSGIGRATALAFAKKGYDLLLAARRTEEGETLVREIRGLGREALFVRTDVSREADVAALVEKGLAKFGRLDAAFNNAGVEGKAFIGVEQHDRASYAEVFDVNVFGVIASMKHEIPAMLARGGGAIVNNASIAGLIGFPGMSIYSASKHAVVGLTKVAALELAPRGIRVNSVCPGAIETEMYDRFAKDDAVQKQMAALHPMGRVGQAEEIATAVVWLCSPEASFVTGAQLPIDGGFTAQ